MALALSRLRNILNSGTLFVSLALVSISPAVLYLTIHGKMLMDNTYPQGKWEWYRGPSWDLDTHHNIKLTYEYSNENMIITAGAVSALAGLVGFVGFFVAGQSSKAASQNPTLLLQVLPGSIGFIVTFIAFVYTQVIYDTDNRGKCHWTQGYNPGNKLHCTREQAACHIVGYFSKEPSRLAHIYNTKRTICGETQTGRHLVAPLFVASVLMCGFAVGKLLIEKRENRFVESADERVDRLERQEE